MLLINIESLSDNELRYIAQQEELEDWDSLSREELIDELQDLYDEDDAVLPDTLSGSSRRKFVNTLTDIQSDNVLSLPGVEPLPESYNETSIHLVMKDMDWAYVFWSLSTQLRSELEESGEDLVLRNIRLDANGEQVAEYDISVSLSDDNWTIELPHPGYSYQVLLLSVRGGKERVICRSTVLSTTKSWLSSHPAELHDDVTFRVQFSSLILKGGSVIGIRQIESLIKEAGDEYSEEAGK